MACVVGGGCGLGVGGGGSRMVAGLTVGHLMI